MNTWNSKQRTGSLGNNIGTKLHNDAPSTAATDGNIEENFRVPVLQSENGIVLAAEKRVVSKLLAKSKNSEKTYVLDNHAVCLVAGLTADANILTQNCRLQCLYARTSGALPAITHT